MIAPGAPTGLTMSLRDTATLVHAAVEARSLVPLQAAAYDEHAATLFPKAWDEDRALAVAAVVDAMDDPVIGSLSDLYDLELDDLSTAYPRPTLPEIWAALERPANWTMIGAGVETGARWRAWGLSTRRSTGVLVVHRVDLPWIPAADPIAIPLVLAD